MASSEVATVGSGSAVRLRGLTRLFGDKVAVAGVDLDVPHGSFFGLVGPNGAGKTTLLSMTTGLLRPAALAALRLAARHLGAHLPETLFALSPRG